METQKQKRDMQQLIGNALRIGVVTACLVAAIGGAIYLCNHGSEPMPDYTTFDAHPSTDITTLNGILNGVLNITATGWIQLGVLLLILTPIVRIILSLCDFAIEHNWLYVGITSIVLLVILLNSISI